MGSNNTTEEMHLRIRALEDRLEVQFLIWSVTLNSDLNRWSDWRACFAEDATIDYGSLFGPNSQNLSIDAHEKNLLSFITGFDFRQHQITNFAIEIDGDNAVVQSQVHAVHRLDEKIYEVHGVYNHRLERRPNGWKIVYLRPDITYQSGADLIVVARARVSERRPR